MINKAIIETNDHTSDYNCVMAMQTKQTSMIKQPQI